MTKIIDFLFGFAILIIALALTVGAMLGWAFNIAKLIGTEAAFVGDQAVLSIVRILGIFIAPLGVGMGWLV